MDVMRRDRQRTIAIVLGGLAGAPHAEVGAMLLRLGHGANCGEVPRAADSRALVWVLTSVISDCESVDTVEGSNDCKSAGIAFGGSNPPRPTQVLVSKL
jgi:hypothetical protein